MLGPQALHPHPGHLHRDPGGYHSHVILRHPFLTGNVPHVPRADHLRTCLLDQGDSITGVVSSHVGHQHEVGPLYVIKGDWAIGVNRDAGVDIHHFAIVGDDLDERDAQVAQSGQGRLLSRESLVAGKTSPACQST